MADGQRRRGRIPGPRALLLQQRPVVDDGPDGSPRRYAQEGNDLCEAPGEEDAPVAREDGVDAVADFWAGEDAQEGILVPGEEEGACR